ncbi:MAG: hypothetical protein D6723_12575 [Acidobacteria bacterium]|nr:MAG: hypothetical protein D6723_12575 [Acidobacteriota bacterium]
MDVRGMERTLTACATLIFEGVVHGASEPHRGDKKVSWKIFAFFAPLRWILEGGIRAGSDDGRGVGVLLGI